MARHRGGFLALGLTALIGLLAPEGRAETIAMTVITNGHTIMIIGSLISSQSSTSFVVDTTALNNALIADGSSYQFSSLEASSNFQGSWEPQGGTLTTFGGLYVPTTATGATGDLVIATTEGGFAAPTGPGGMLASTTKSDYINVATGTQTYTSSLNGGIPLQSPSLVTKSSGTSENKPSLQVTVAVGPVSSGYVLGNTLAFNITQNSTAEAQDGFSGSAQVTTASTVPEPASLLMMLTGMPLPLGVLCLLRRRAAA